MVLLFFVQFCSGQDDSSTILNTRFTKYNLENVQEKLFVHTDKAFYLSGEITWFKIYAVDASLNQSMDLSKVAYVEIIDRNNTQIIKGKISLKKGSGNGSFLLPKSLPTGNYVMRAYTSWMKNFSADFYFEKSITVINSLKEPMKQVQGDSTGYDIQFFPEGGNLVKGVRSKVAFRVVGRDGKGRDCMGKILNQNGIEVANFQTLQFGLGHFYFMPLAGEKYQAQIKSGDTILQAALPQIHEQGYVMQVTDSGKNLIKVVVNTDLKTADEMVRLFIHTRQIPRLQTTGSLANHEAIFIVDKNLLGEGISHFTLFNNKQQPICERLYFKRPASMEISVKSKKIEYSTREKITIDIGARDRIDKPVAADLSVSVFQEDSLQTLENTDILNYLWLSSDLKGRIESPDFYFRDSSALVDEAMENLMLTHGWSRFRWEDVLQPSSKRPEWLPEYETHLVNGRVFNKNTALPAENITAYLSVRATNFRFNTATSNKDGKLYFNMPGLFGNEEIIVQTNSSKDSAYRIEILNPFSDKFSTNTLPAFSFSGDLHSLLLAHSISTQVQNAYFAEKTTHFYSPFTDSLAFYGPPDYQYKLGDYTRFTSLEEIFREYVAEIGVRKSEGKTHLLVWKDDKSLKIGDPLVLLDGVPYFDMDSVLKFDPLKIRKLEIMKRKYYIGPVVADGIVSLFTYAGDLEGTPLEPNAIVLEYEGLQLEREFFSPVYETQKEIKSRLPDFRTTLYWSPEIITDKSGNQQCSFYTSDQPGNYVVSVQGISLNGLAGTKVMRFTVK